MSLETMTKIGSYTVPSNTASFTLSNIPQGYTDLVIKLNSKTNHTSDYDLIYFHINGDSTAANYPYVRLQGEGNTSTTTSSNGGIYVRTSGASSAATNFFGNAEITIFNYSENNYKPFSVDSVEEINASGGVAAYFNGVYYGVAPVTSLTFYPNNATIAANTSVTLYGMKNAQKTVGNSIKATGGNIIFDGTYVTHTFNSTGAFTPTQPLVADVLTIAGGGCGGGGNGGGGGAGGLVYSPLQTLATSSYAITIGAGGSGGLTNNRGPAGSNSQFGALTAAIGGGGGGGFDTNSTGGNGGSGGGGGSYSSTGGSLAGGTGSQGNNGGTGFNPGGYPYHGGVGGGAGAAGANATSLVCGNGGVGALYFGSYYAGGGGGGGDLGSGTTTFGTGGNGGGGVGGSPQGSASNGTINTGGGGGGEGGGGGGANGGSGVVIIRYKG